MMKIDPKHLKLIEDIISEIIPDIEVRAFGSRVNGNSRKHSDLDLALISCDKLDLKKVLLLSEAFDESDLPFRVDIVDYHRVDMTFRSIIDENYVVIQEGK